MKKFLSYVLFELLCVIVVLRAVASLEFQSLCALLFMLVVVAICRGLSSALHHISVYYVKANLVAYPRVGGGY